MCYYQKALSELATTSINEEAKTRACRIGEYLPLSINSNYCVKGDARGKECSWQCRRHKSCRFDSWIGMIPWRRKRLSTAIFLPEESHGQRSMGCYSP